MFTSRVVVLMYTRLHNSFFIISDDASNFDDVCGKNQYDYMGYGSDLKEWIDEFEE